MMFSCEEIGVKRSPCYSGTVVITATEKLS